ncbi:MAG: HEAT repeat domain-containing protein [candidate division Zixibacteria bacterium]|nr:HEAT repeat domain-containing protein [candidate division Zixibacteria bacterium]
MPKNEPDWSILSEEIVTVTPEMAATAKDLLAYVVRTLKTMLLYPQNNPIPGEFKKNLFDKFSKYLTGYDELTLLADQNRIQLGSELIHEDNSQEEGVALLMYRDGIREISFSKGLTFEEMENFLNALKTALQSKSGDDDLVTLLWAKDFLHLKYTVVELTTDLPEPKLLDTKTAELNEKIYYSEVSLDGRDLPPVPDGEPLLEISEFSSAEIARLLKNVASFQQEELAEINTLLQIENFYHGQAEVIPILFEILEQEKDFGEFQLVLGLVQNVHDQFVSGAKFDLAGQVLTSLKKSRQHYSAASEDKAEKLKQALERCGDKIHLDKIAEWLNQEMQNDLEHLYQYLIVLEPEAVTRLVEMLAELKFFSARKMLCRVLEHFSKSNLDLVASGLDHRRWYVVRNVVLTLGKVKDPRIITELKKTLKHSDWRVRRETILALSKLNTAESKLLLVESLKDADRKIRIQAVRALAYSQEKRALEPLWLQVNNAKFLERGEDEVKEIFDALVVIDQELGLEYLFRYIQKFHFWYRNRYLAFKLLALKAMQKSDSPQLRGCLERITHMGNRSLRSQAKVLLERINLKTQKGKPVELSGKHKD